MRLLRRAGGRRVGRPLSMRVIDNELWRGNEVVVAVCVVELEIQVQDVNDNDLGGTCRYGSSSQSEWIYCK
jgi:hypothetical protein